MLEMVTPAADPSLLSLSELWTAVEGLEGADSITDRDLSAIGIEVASYIASLCGVADADGYPLTLRKESLRETMWPECVLNVLDLSRRFVNVTSISENSVALVVSDNYIVNKSFGKIKRMANNAYSTWASGKIVVEYDAGFDIVPPDLKYVAVDLVRLRLAQRGRDPFLQQIQTDGIDRMIYRDQSASYTDIETSVENRLARFAAVMIA